MRIRLFAFVTALVLVIPAVAQASFVANYAGTCLNDCNSIGANNNSPVSGQLTIAGSPNDYPNEGPYVTSGDIEAFLFHLGQEVFSSAAGDSAQITGNIRVCVICGGIGLGVLRQPAPPQGGPYLLTVVRAADGFEFLHDFSFPDWGVHDDQDELIATGDGRFTDIETIPEPGTLALMSLALVGLGAARRRRH